MKTDTPVAIAKAFDYPTLTPIDRPILTPPNGHKKYCYIHAVPLVQVRSWRR